MKRILIVSIIGFVLSAQGNLFAESLDERFQEQVNETIEVMDYSQLEKALYLLNEIKPKKITIPSVAVQADPLVSATSMRRGSLDYYETLAAIAHTLGDKITRNESLTNMYTHYKKLNYRQKIDNFPQMMRILRFNIKLNRIDDAGQIVKTINNSINNIDLLYTLVSILHTSKEMSNSLPSTIDHLKSQSKSIDAKISLARLLYNWKMTEDAQLVMKNLLKKIRKSDHFYTFCNLADTNKDTEMFAQGLESWKKWCSRYSSYKILLEFMETKNIDTEQQQAIVRKMYDNASTFNHFDFLIKKCVVKKWNDLALEIQDVMLSEFKKNRLDIDYRKIPDPHFLYTQEELPVRQSIDVFTYSGALNEKMGSVDFADNFYRKGLILDTNEYLGNAGFLLTGNLNRFFYYYNLADPWTSALEANLLKYYNKVKSEKEKELAQLTGQSEKTIKKSNKPRRFREGHLLNLFLALVMCSLGWIVFFLNDKPAKSTGKVHNG